MGSPCKPSTEQHHLGIPSKVRAASSCSLVLEVALLPWAPSCGLCRCLSALEDGTRAILLNKRVIRSKFYPLERIRRLIERTQRQVGPGQAAGPPAPVSRRYFTDPLAGSVFSLETHRDGRCNVAELKGAGVELGGHGVQKTLPQRPPWLRGSDPTCTVPLHKDSKTGL